MPEGLQSEFQRCSCALKVVQEIENKKCSYCIVFTPIVDAFAVKDFMSAKCRRNT